VNDRDLRVSLRAVVWGVVIRIDVGVVGLRGVGVNKGLRWVKRDICSSDVPIPFSQCLSLTKRMIEVERSYGLEPDRDFERTWRSIYDKII